MRNLIKRCFNLLTTIFFGISIKKLGRDRKRRQPIKKLANPLLKIKNYKIGQNG